MRCSEFHGTSTPVAYTCGRCAMFYYDHTTLIEHLYWRHGTESDVCKSCKLKKWSFAVHKCYHLPNMKSDFTAGVKKYAVRDVGLEHALEVNEVVTVDPTSAADNDIETSDTESMTSGDSSYFSERESKYCYCGKFIEGADMIGCDSRTCALEWFHYKCVGINEVPEGSWHCPECLKRC